MSNNLILANLNRIKNFDLNLLLIFETMFIYNSVKIVAEKLNTSSPTVSQSLNKLREEFSDPLFIRQGMGLVPTTVAINLHEKLGGMFSTLVNSVMNLSSTTTTRMKFVLYSSPYLALRLLPDLYAAIENSDIACEIQHISADSALNSGEQVLSFRKADIVLDTVPHYNFSTVTSLFMQENVVAVCRKDHPRLDKLLTREQMEHETFTGLNAKSESLQRIQQSIRNNLGERTFSFTSDSILLNSAISEKSNSISFVPEGFMDKFGESLDLKRLECDFQIEPYNVYMSYKKSALTNEHFINLINLIEKDVFISTESQITDASSLIYGG